MTEPLNETLIEKDPFSKVAQLQIAVKAGSLMDPAGLKGLAHATGRALLRGTRKRSRAQLTAAIERLGASLSVGTDHEKTVLRGAVIAENFDAFLALVREVLLEPAFSSDEIDTLKSILQGEVQASFQDPQELALRAVLQNSFRGTGAETMPDGTVAGIEALTAGKLREFYQSHYVRGNFVTALVSPFEKEEASARLQKSLAEFMGPAPAFGAMPESALSGRGGIVVHREGMATSPVYVIARGVGDSDPVLPGLELGNFVFGEDFTARLMQVLRAENGWTYGVSSGYRQLLGPQATRGFFSLYLFPSAEHAALAIPKALSMLEEYASEGITQEEFEKAREALGQSYAFKSATAEQRLILKLRKTYTGRSFPTPAAYAKWLLELSREQINQAIRASLKTDSLRIVTVGDSKLLSPILKKLVGSVKTLQPEELGG